MNTNVTELSGGLSCCDSGRHIQLQPLSRRSTDRNTFSKYNQEKSKASTDDIFLRFPIRYHRIPNNHSLYTSGFKADLERKSK